MSTYDSFPTANAIWIDAMIAQDGPHWDYTSLGQQNIITYSFDYSSSQLYNTERSNGADLSTLHPFNASEQSAVSSALAQVSAITGVQFQQTTSSAAEVYFAVYDLGSSMAGDTVWNAAVNNGAYSCEADVLIGSTYADMSPGTWGYQTLLHEIGHVMGLKHPGNYNTAGTPNPGPYSIVASASGADTLCGNQGNDTLVAGLGADFLYGGKDNDMVKGNPNSRVGCLLAGNMGDDVIDAGGGPDSLYGGQGNDILVGGAGADTLSGDLGDDMLFSGSGPDTFVFNPNGGHDLVEGFTPAKDHLRISGPYTITNDGHGNAAIRLVNSGSDDLLTLVGITQAALQANATHWIISG